MFKNTFQSGFLSILYSIGSKPLQIWEKQVSSHAARAPFPSPFPPRASCRTDHATRLAAATAPRGPRPAPRAARACPRRARHGSCEPAEAAPPRPRHSATAADDCVPA